MKKITTLAVAFLTIFLFSFTKEKTTSAFQEKLLEAKMSFNMPQGYKEVPIINNMQMNYEYAIKNTEKDFEIRYTIRPMVNELKSYQEKEKNKKEGETNVNPNKLYKVSFVTISFNISGGKLSKSSNFPPEAVKAEFNADWGAFTMVEAGKEFGQDYKYCFMVAIHKEDVADAYCFYLANDQQTLKEQLQPVFHNLKFN